MLAPVGARPASARPSSRNGGLRAAAKKGARAKPQEKSVLHLIEKGGLKTTAPGIGFRKSKELENRDGYEHIRWGQTIMGVDEGDGWLKVKKGFQPRFLPMAFKGVPVVVTLATKAEMEAAVARAATRARRKAAKASAEALRPDSPRAGATADEAGAARPASASPAGFLSPTPPERPASGLSEHMVSASYRQFQRRSARADLFSPKPPPHGVPEEVALPPACRQLPAAWRPGAQQVLDMAEEAGLSSGEAASALLVGCPAMEALTRVAPADPKEGGERCVKLAEAVKDVRRAVTCSEGIGVEHVLAALAMLAGARHVGAVDACEMALEEAPELLRLMPSLVRLDLSRNAKLDYLVPLRACAHLQVVDLSGCPKLRDLRPLATLPFLRVVDLSFCTEVEDVGQLLLNQPEVAEDAWTSRKGEVPLGHPALEWLSLSGCRSMRHGVDKMRHCHKLAHVDLFDCLDVCPTECYQASRAPQLRTFVWPSGGPGGMIESLARAQAWPRARLAAATAAATAAAAEKLAMVKGGRRGPELAAVSGRTHRMEMTAATRCAGALGIEVEGLLEEEALADRRAQKRLSKDVGKLKLPQTFADEDEENEEDSDYEAAPDVQEMPKRIGPMGFLRALRSDKFEVKGSELLDLFHVLDADGDGAISVLDMDSADRGLPTLQEMNRAIGLLLSRHKGFPDCAAADLAGGRDWIDPPRIQECLVIAGLEEQLAERVPRALEHCALPHFRRGDPESIETGLRHAVAAYGIAYVASSVDGFRDFVRKHYGAAEKAFEAFDASKSGRLSREDFEEACGKLEWPPAKQAGLPEALWRVLSSAADADGCVAPEDFERLLADFDSEVALEAMAAVGRAVLRYPADRRRYFGNALTEGGVRQRARSKETRSATKVAVQGNGVAPDEFASAWEAIVKHERLHEQHPSLPRVGRFVFGLLDVYDCNTLASEEIEFLTGSLSRRAEHASLLKFLAFVKRKSTVEEAFAKWHEGETAPVDIMVKVDRRKSRRRSSSSGSKK